MATAEHTLRIIIKSVDQTNGFKNINNAAKGLQQRLSTMGASLMRNLTLPLVGVGIAGVKSFMGLDKAMRNIQSVGRQSEEELTGLRDTFQAMSMDLRITTDNSTALAKAFYDIQGAGFETDDAMVVLNASTKAASAGLTDTTVAMEGVVAVLNSYGLGAEHATWASDLMFRAVDRGVGSFEELAGSLSNVVPTAKAAGISFETLMAAQATLSKQGFSFSEATVSLNQAITAFLKPSTAMRGVLSELGYENGLAAIQQLGFAGALDAVATAVDNDAAKMSELIGSVRGFRAAASLTGASAQMFADDLAAMEDATGATAAAFEVQTRSFAAQWKNFQNTITVGLQEIGEALAPTLAKITELLGGLIRAFVALPDPIKQAIVGVGALLAILGPALLITAKIIGAFSAVKAAILAISTAAPLLGTAFTLMTGPVGLTVLAIGGLIAAGYALIKNWDSIKAGAQRFAESIRTTIANIDLQKVAENITRFFLELPGRLVKLNYEITKGMIQFGIDMTLGLAKGLIQGSVAVIKAIIQIGEGIANGIKGFFRIGSPSKLMEGFGLDTMAGFNQGLTTGFNQSVDLIQSRNEQMANLARQNGERIVRAREFTVEQEERIENARIPLAQARAESLLRIEQNLAQGRTLIAAQGFQMVQGIYRGEAERFKFQQTQFAFAGERRITLNQPGTATGLASTRTMADLSEAERIQATASSVAVRGELAKVLGEMAPGILGGIRAGVGGAQRLGMGIAQAAVGNMNIENIVVPEGTTREQVEAIVNELAKRLGNRGLTGRSVTL